MSNTRINKRLLSVVLCFAMLISYIPLWSISASAENIYYDRVADANTMDNWQKYFDLNNLDTSNAGGVWTDKSVFTDAAAFDGKVSMINNNRNFLTALSAIAANKEVVGYTTIPTDTVLVLDLSGSMENSDSESDLVQAANNAIKTLLAANKNNRVGVVLYSAAGTTGSSTYEESVTRILQIDRYTTGSDGVYLNLSNQGVVSVDSDVENSSDDVMSARKSFGGGTYIQAGLWEAMKMFEEMDTVIGDNNWQSGDSRMPILVLMSDGAPSTGTSYYDDVENSQYTRTSGGGRPGGQQTQTVKGSDVGNGNESNLTAGNAFLTQLTASYVVNRIQTHYQNADNDVRGLFYTLGFNIGNNSVAQSVMNPDASTLTNSLWSAYNNLESGSFSVNVKGRNGNNTNVTVTKNSYATGKSYVDEYFSASGDGLTEAFDDIVEEIILQSRYYPTHLEGGSPDFSGYVEFTDTLGAYMEVKDIKGILLGSTLYDGHMMASKLADTTTGGLGTVENPTSLGDEFIRAVKTRLGIADTADAQALVAKAFADGQLKYNSADDWSNYIAWYAKADGTYAGFYDEDGTEPLPADAVYINRSYGFLGETTGSIKNSDMMYMSVQVHINIETGEQTVIWKIPASLVPMITYLVSLEGTNVDTATNVSIAVENAENIAPIRLIYETGLRSDLNEFNITRITDAEHISADGHTRVFWNNYFDISASSHDEHITAISEFTPNKDNERYYFTFDSAVFKKNGSDYVLVDQNETLSENGEYYHRRYIFKQGETKPVFFYEKMSAASVATAAWSSAYETLTGEIGAWVVPKGTPARELQMYDEQKSVNSTNSAKMVFHPYITEQNNLVYVDMNLGNNGLLSVTPATGIKISKTIDVFETGTSESFKFRVTAPVSGSYNSWITDLDKTPSGVPTTAAFVNGVYEFELKKDQTLWISGLPAGTAYTVEEISDNSDYKVMSVHVNGISTGTVAEGTVAQYLIDDIDFVNTAVGEGDLVVTKKVVDVSGNSVDVNDSIKFTAEIMLTDVSGDPINGTFTSSAGDISVQDGKYSVALSEGESFVIRGLPEKTEYAVTESNIPNGFALNSQESQLTGVVDASANDQALIVNTYTPTGTNGQNVSVQITKEITGSRENWLTGESYTFHLERMDLTRAVGSVIATATIDESDAAKTHLFTLAGENYTVAGTYYYRITEVQGTQGGITYDTADRRFSVVVADSDMDGDLEIISVENMLNTTVSGSWLVAASFNNVYAPTGTATATVNIQKVLAGHALNGYQFALYDADPSVSTEVNELIKSALTDADGKAAIILNYSAADAGKTYTYYLAELNRGATINNINYSEAVYKVEVTVKDNLDGTISAETAISGLAQGATMPTFTNVYVPSESDYITISGKKEIIGDRVLNANEFSFVLNAVTDGAPMPAQTVVKNAADGSFAFPAIEFGDAHKGNTYVYTVTEDDSVMIGGFDYDNTVYTVTVTVTDNGTNVTATAVIQKGTDNAENIVFQNTYDAQDAEITLSGTKLLTGKTMQNGEFEFELKAVTADAPMPVSTTVRNTAAGLIDFGKITFSKAGTYVYQLTEKDGGNTNYDYDESVYTVTVTVTDNSQGVLSANTELVKDNMPSTEIVFRNGFTPTPITYDIYADFGGTKVLEGRALAPEEFEFALINAQSGQQIGETVKNDADGNFKFPAVTLSAVGIHHFKITEIVGSEKNITYDTSSFHIRLEVVQGDDGILSIADKQLYIGIVTKQEVGGVLTEVTAYEDITASGSIRFTNKYIEPIPEPTTEPTSAPTTEPTTEPTSAPTTEPTTEPTSAPTTEPTTEPTSAPTTEPTTEPTSAPTTEPTAEPTSAPTTEPIAEPTSAPTAMPTVPGTDTETSNNPNTGDNGIHLWFVMLILSCGGILATAFSYGKKKESGHN